ncbi:MAG TPA: chromosome segregation protein SMC [Myxococcales bacterium]|jgi:chromosome segregation protein
MRIKRLDICGFKSFMDRAVFTFGDGVTGVVGPNGCGKSNVVDAIRWSMGEQSAKHLRGRSMEDVIFAGSEHKPALGMAEVTITFHNDRPELLPAPFQAYSEVSVTRRLFRNGESEYLINKTPTRLIDVTELFLGTGVGTKAYSIIEQGRIGLIVSAKPEDRRSLIEEAAGVTRYKSRRKAAERKMEYTEQNLLRVGDIVRELGSRLGVLERQARKAEKYKRLKSEMKDIELHTATLKYLELTAEAKAAHESAESLTGEEKELTLRVIGAEAAIEQCREKAAADERALRVLDEKAHATDNEMKVGATNLEAWGRELEAFGQRVGEAERELAEIAAASATLNAEREALEAQRSSLDGLATDDDRRLITVREELARLAKEEELTVERLDSERSLLVSALSRIASGKSHLENLTRQKADLEARVSRVGAERDELLSHARTLEESREGFHEKLGASRQMRLAIEERRAGEEEALERSRREFMENEARLIAVREELSDRRSRLVSLREIEKNYEGYGRGVRAVMAHAGDSPAAQGIHGLVSDVVRAPPELERAIEAVLGDRLQTVIVSDKEKGLSLATFLKESQEGRGAFLPLTVDPGEPVVEPDPSVLGVVGAAATLVTCAEQFSLLLRHLLGDVVVVKDLDAAVAYSRTGRPHTIVTLDGEVIEPSGCIVGGTLEGPGVGALHKKREIADLEEKVKIIEGELSICQEKHRRMAEHIGQLEGTLKGLNKDSHSEDLTVVEQEKDLHRTTEDLSRTRERLEKLTVELDAMHRALSEIGAEETSASGQGAQAESEREGRESRVRELSEQLASARTRLAELNAERTNLQVKVAADFERRESVEKSHSRATSTLHELSERQIRLEATVKEAAERREALQGKSEGMREGIQKLALELDAMQGERFTARAACEEQTEKLRTDENELRGVRKRLEELQSGLAVHALREREFVLERAHLCDSIRDRYAVELSVELYDYHWKKPPTAEMEAELKDLREQVERMGEINLTAIEEHKDLVERHDFLKKQKGDLEQSLAQLRRAIVRINKTSKERFDQAFEVVNEKFQQVFPRLFNGGRASLVLVPSESGGDPGIEILAQPPGKKLQSVNLLSGGEKALTAVALIFAIFLIKPTPFCLLDEVDAPLDDANVGRYNEIVREMSKVSQFILITHNKRTMQIADTMYGVTMEEPGVSKIVSVKLTERAAAQPTPEQAPTPEQTPTPAVSA